MLLARAPAGFSDPYCVSVCWCVGYCDC